MSLSDRERRLLAEMEAALASEDPGLQSALGKGGTTTLLRVGSPSLIKGILILVAGFATLFAGVIAQLPPLGVAGFAIALAGVISALKSLQAPARPASPAANRARTSWGDRLQQRWDERNNQ